MALVAVGTPVTENVLFNKGYVTVNGQQLADLTDISVTQEFSIKDLYVLGSIKARKKERYEFKCGFKAKASSFNMALLSYLYGSSVTDAGGYDYSIVDGQQASISSLVVTTYIGNDTTQPVQWQFTNAVVKASPVNIKMNDYTEMDLEVEATDVLLVSLASSQ